MEKWYDDGQVNPHIQSNPSTEKKEEKDPWNHRSKGMLCSTCMFYVQKGGNEGVGRCRRNAPTMNGYPAVFTSDWCGNHRIDEERLLCG